LNPNICAEYSCYSSGLSETNFPGMDVIDLPETAACVANRAAYLIDRPYHSYLFKLTQAYRSDTPSTVTKNGM
jgi:hypothetical protein